jgi:hypothetical protein
LSSGPQHLKGLPVGVLSGRYEFAGLQRDASAAFETFKDLLSPALSGADDFRKLFEQRTRLSL